MVTLQETLSNLVKRKAHVTITIRSCPENLIEGTLVNFDLNFRTYTIINNGNLYVINKEDVSTLKAQSENHLN